MDQAQSVLVKALDRAMMVLESARKRKDLYFSRIEPSALIDWLNGFRAGCSIVGLEWSPASRRQVVERRGLEFSAAAWETEQFQERGLRDEQIVDELLAIEIEMWRCTHDGRARSD
jgi:hypothetical protein